MRWSARIAVAAAVLAMLGPGSPAAQAQRCWQVVPATLEITWQARWGETLVTGGFRDARVAITFDEDAPEKARIVAEIAVDSLYASDPEAVDLLRDSAWFDPAQYPLARYAATGLVTTGAQGPGRRYRAEGLLTLKGRTAPVPLVILLTPTDDGIAAEAQAVIDRTVFGIGAGPIAAQTAPEVPIHIRLRARPASCEQTGILYENHR